MKRSKKLYILLGVLVVACAATFALTQFEEEKEQIKATGEIILEVPSDTVQSLSWEYGETTLAFHKDEKWLYDEDEAFPVDVEAVHELLDQFEAFGVSFVIEEVSDYSMYGLDEPECIIHFATAEQSYTMELGAFSNMDQERYISIGDGNVYLAKVDPLERFDAVLSDMIDHDEDLAYEQITRIKFEGAENYTIFYEEESNATYCADDVYFTELNGATLPLDTDLVGTWLESLTTLNPTNYVTYNVTEEELKSYNLVSPELTVSVDYTDTDEDGNEVSSTFVLSVSRDPEELAAAEEAEANDEEPEEVTTYVRIGQSQIVYRISEYSSESLMAASYDDLRHREVLTAAFEDIYKLDITLESAEHTIAVDEDVESDDDERVWKYQEEEIDISDLQSELMGLRASGTESFTAEGSADKEELRLTAYLDNKTHPQVEIVLYRYDGSECIAHVNGETFARINRADVVDLIEAINGIVL